MLSLLSGLVARARSLARGVRRTGDVDAEMEEEFRCHIELRAAELMRSGLPAREATRRARLEFGSTARYKDEGRESRGLRRFDDLRASWLDFKLGFRMLVRRAHAPSARCRADGGAEGGLNYWDWGLGTRHY